MVYFFLKFWNKYFSNTIGKLQGLLNVNIN